MQEFFATGTDGQKVHASVEAYIMNTLLGDGHLLQMNRIGAIAVVTAYMKLGDYQTVIWDWRAQQDPDVGWIIAELKTLEAAEGFHFALTQSLYNGEFGSTLREEAARYPDVGSIIPQ